LNLTQLIVGAVVQPLAQFLAGAEERHALFFNRNGFARAGITPLPRRPNFHGEGAETAQLNAVAFGESHRNLVKHRGNNSLDIAMI